MKEDNENYTDDIKQEEEEDKEDKEEAEGEEEKEEEEDNEDDKKKKDIAFGEREGKDNCRRKICGSKENFINDKAELCPYHNVFPKQIIIKEKKKKL